MNSFDIFDTLIGRWYYSSHSIFEEIESNGVKGFKQNRISAEVMGGESFADIYDNYQKITGISDTEKESLKQTEFSMELARTFPIKENVAKLTPDCLIISDMYYNKEELRLILAANGITTFSDILCGRGIKAFGTVWSQVNPDLHLDDNPGVCNVARNQGITVDQYEGYYLTNNELLIMEAGFPKLAYMCRVLRLSNPKIEVTDRQVWEDQTQSNIPLLVLLSPYLHGLMSANKYSQLLFTERDCISFYDIFSAMFPDDNAKRFSTCRNLYMSPSDTFIDYIKRTYTPKSLIIDMQGTGKTCVDFFNRFLDIDPNYLVVVCCDYHQKPGISNMFTCLDGFTDKIEKMNYAPLGKLIDVTYRAIREERVESKYIDTQLEVIALAVQFIKSGFVIEKHPARSLVLHKALLRYIEGYCTISEVVNHWII